MLLAEYQILHILNKLNNKKKKEDCLAHSGWGVSNFMTSYSLLSPIYLNFGIIIGY